MPPSDFEQIFQALQQARVRYLVVGGVAMVLHGHPRFTADLDLVLALDRDNVLSALDALSQLGYRPQAPVPANALADPATRKEWIHEKGLTVFSLWSDKHPATSVDVFVEEPFPFSEAYSRATQVDLEGVVVPVLSIPDLIELKRRTGRGKDLDDVRALEALLEEQEDG